MREIPLSSGKIAIVDDEDWQRISAHKWSAEKRPRKHRGDVWYAYRIEKRASHDVKIYMHREIIGAARGRLTDHKDGNGLHNWRGNLRVATNSQNGANSIIPTADTRSGYRGVHWRRSGRNWAAQIYVKGEHKYLGRFDCPAEAARAYDTAARQHFGEFAKLNFPGEPAPFIREIAPQQEAVLP